MKSNNSSKNPWLALKTYEEEDQHKFKGRDKDVDNITTLLEQNECVVCYAASGEGKSSLINAGLCPRLKQENYFPIKIFFTQEEQDLDDIDFDKVVSSKIKSCIESYNNDIENNVSKYENDIEKNLLSNLKVEFIRQDKYRDVELPDSLWWSLRTGTIQTALEKQCIPILIFDQFEEIFRTRWKDSFFKWMEILMRDKCPDENVDDSYLPTRKLFKVLFSMRHEYVGELDYWCSQRMYIPQMMRNRYFLKPLTREQSLNIIKGQNYYNDAVADKTISCAQDIIGIAKKDKISQSDEVSAIVLSLICKLLYEKWSEDIDYSIDKAQYKEVIYDYYLKTMKEIGIGDDARFNIEETLVSETKTKHRIPVSDKRLRKINFNNFKDKLKDEHIVKLDTIGNTEYVEFIHDRLVEAIYDKYKEETEKREYDKKIEELKKKRKRNMFFITFSLIILAIVSILLVNAKRNEKKYLIAQAKFIAKVASNLIKENKIYESIRLLNYVKGNNRECHKVADFEGSYRELDDKFDAVDGIFVHEKLIRTINLSLDGKYIITASDDKTAKLWSLDNKQLLLTLNHDYVVASANFSSDGKYIVTASWDSTARIWSTKNGICIDTLFHSSAVQSANFSHNGRYIITASDDKTAKLWSFDDGNCRCLHTFNHSDLVKDAYFSHNCKFIITESLGRSSIWLTDSIGNIPYFSYDNYFIKFSLDEKHFITKTNKGQQLLLWSADDRVCLDTIEIGYKHSFIYDADFSNDGKYIIIASEEGPKLWSISYRVLYSFDEVDKIYSASFDPQGDYIITRTIEGIDILSVKNRKKILSFSYDKGCRFASFDNSGEHILTISDNLLSLLSFKRPEHSLKDLGYKKIKFSHNGNYCVTMSAKYSMLWMTENIKPLCPLDHKSVYDVDFSIDDKYLLTKSNDTIRLWSIDETKCIGLLPNCSGTINTVFSPTGKYVITESIFEDTLRLWSVKSRKVVHTFYHKSEMDLGPCAISSDDKYILLRTSDNNYGIWSIDNEEYRCEINHGNCISYAKFHTDYVLTCGSNNAAIAKLWNINSGKCRSVFPHKGIVKTANFSPDGKYVVTASSDKTAKLWSVDGEYIDSFYHEEQVDFAYFSTCGKYVVTVCNSYPLSSLRIFSVEKKGLIYTKYYNNQICFVNFSSDGQYVVVIFGDNKNDKIQIKSLDIIMSKWSEILGPNAELTDEEKEKYYLN